MSLETFVKACFRSVGLDLMRVKNSPAVTWLGLRSAGIRTIIDVGANTGQFAREASKHFPQAEMFCFEPLAAPFRELQHWAASQNGRVHVFKFALAETSGERNFFLHSDHSTSSSFLETTLLNERHYPSTRKQENVTVTMETLDEALSGHLNRMRPPILLKLDVQGYEDRVLRGGMHVLSRASACLLEVDLDGLYKDQANFRELVNILYAVGYRYAGNLDQVYAEDGHVIFGDALFVKAELPGVSSRGVSKG